jgi:hypothetical protein
VWPASKTTARTVERPMTREFTAEISLTGA